MSRIVDFLIEAWERLMRLCGFDRVKKSKREFDLEEKGRFARWFYFVRPLIMFLLLVYLGVLIWRFGWIRGEDMTYPQSVLTESHLVSAGEETAPESGVQKVKTCGRSQMVAMQIKLIDILVNQNDWAPGTPMYSMGFLGLVEFEATPFFDNKASFQIGALNALRRMSIELNDTIGRVRGTSAVDKDLEAATSRLRVNERAWVINNPFDRQLSTISVSAALSYRGAIRLYQNYNDRLESCDALFDARADNLRVVLDRITKDIGSLTDQLAKRSQGMQYDVKLDVFVDAEGNDRGWFDFRADNLFHQARGLMFAYHGLLQAMRADFADVIDKRDLTDVWDRMEQHVAEAAVLRPWIVSNGREDGLFMPDHLSIMAENMHRARGNMVELRDILDR
jgi:hypothetical protein